MTQAAYLINVMKKKNNSTIRRKKFYGKDGEVADPVVEYMDIFSFPQELGETLGRAIYVGNSCSF